MFLKEIKKAIDAQIDKIEDEIRREPDITDDLVIKVLEIVRDKLGIADNDDVSED